MAEPAAPVAPEPVETQDSVVADSAAVVEVPDTPTPAPVKRAPKRSPNPNRRLRQRRQRRLRLLRRSQRKNRRRFRSIYCDFLWGDQSPHAPPGYAKGPRGPFAYPLRG